MFEVKVKGMKELEKEMDKVLAEVKQELRLGVNEAANAAASVIRTRAPGSLKEAVTTKKLPEKTGYPEASIVGLLWEGYQHQHLIEFGSGPRYHADGKYVGQMPAYPFFRASIYSLRGEIKNIIEKHAKQPIERRR